MKVHPRAPPAGNVWTKPLAPWARAETGIVPSVKTLTHPSSPPGPVPETAPSLASRSRLPLLAVWMGLSLPASAGAPPSAEKAHASPSCQVGYLEFEAVHGLKGVRAAVAQAFTRRDEAAIHFLRERLTELIGKDASRALEVLRWAETSAEPEFTLSLAALREAEAVREASVASRLLVLARTLQDPVRQARVLEALETQHHFEPQALEQLTAWAQREDVVPGLAMHAVRTVGRVMKNDFERTGRFEPYMVKLLEVASSSSDANVRALAVEMSTYLDARLDSASVEALAKRMREDPNAGVREMAALALSSGRDTQAVLKHFREAFPAEKERCVRWALVRYAVRAAGPQALPLLRDFARADRRFQPDAEEFKALYDAGHTDFDRLWPDKKVRHPSCEVGQP